MSSTPMPNFAQQGQAQGQNPFAPIPGLGIGQGPQQYGIDNAEDCRIGANANGQCHQRERGEPRRAQKPAKQVDHSQDDTPEGGKSS